MVKNDFAHSCNENRIKYKGIYHAWIMVNIDGTWQSARFSVSPNTWSRIDLTFAATGGGANVGDGESYTDRYVY